MSDLLQWSIIAFIAAGIGLAIWRGGAANPVGTGQLGRQINSIRSEMHGLGEKVSAIEGRVTEIDRRAATQADVARIEASIAEWNRKIDRLDETMRALDGDLDRLQTTVAAKHAVIEAMSESLRAITDRLEEDRNDKARFAALLEGIEARTQANASITSQVPGFIEKILEQVAGQASSLMTVTRQVDRLYDFIVEKGMSR